MSQETKKETSDEKRRREYEEFLVDDSPKPRGYPRTVPEFYREEGKQRELQHRQHLKLPGVQHGTTACKECVAHRHYGGNFMDSPLPKPTRQPGSAIGPTEYVHTAKHVDYCDNYIGSGPAPTQVLGNGVVEALLSSSSSSSSSSLRSP